MKRNNSGVWAHLGFAGLLFLLIGFWVNRNLRVTGLYMDDLYLWSCFGETPLLEYLFPVGSKRFRFIFNFLAYFVIKPMGANLWLVVPINTVLNVCVALGIFRLTMRVARSNWLGYLTGICFLFSRFAYYQIGQLYGLLETFSLMGVLAVVGLLYDFLTAGAWGEVYGRADRKTDGPAGAFAAGGAGGSARGGAGTAGGALAPGEGGGARGSAGGALAPGAGNGSKNSAGNGSGIGAWGGMGGTGHAGHVTKSAAGDMAASARRANRSYLLACGAYFVTVFIHERYLPLIVLLVAARFMKKLLEKKSPDRLAMRKGRPAGAGKTSGAGSFRSHGIYLLAALAVFGLALAIRMAAIGTLSPAGVGGTDVADTFTLAQAWGFAWAQVGYILGFQPGPTYLNGIAWADMALWAKILVCMGVVALAGAFAPAIWRLCVDKGNRARHLCVFALFFLGIVLCVGATSVTVRLETRWVYVSYCLSLLLLGACYAVVNRSTKNAPKTWIIACVSLYALCFLPTQLYVRAHYPNLYFWQNQQRSNSLADATYGTYGAGIFEKEIVIVDGGDPWMDDFTARTFFKPFNPGWKHPNVRLSYVKDIYGFGLVGRSALVLVQDPGTDRYLDVTSFVRDLKFHVHYGYYDDRWMDREAKLSVVSGATGKIIITGNYPGRMEGGEEVTVVINGDRKETYPVVDNLINVVVEARPGERCDLDIYMNFEVKDALEKRGATPFAALVDVAVQ
ncbi:MAG: hypothetical protein LBR77_06105 [Lachnospiraceae bacterium]|nr:hypothetical protein [Lachnospiraceae bacterium]